MSAIKYCYFSLVAFRFVLTLMPQTGYIHPDEFFQSSEIVYGDLLEVKSLKQWEFDPDEPIRSIAFPYLMVGIPSILLRVFNVKHVFGTEFFPYFLLVLPRLLMCFLSLIHDVCLYKICKLIRKNPYELLIIFASSYVSLIYLTRTFSNSLEAACLSILLYTVILKSVTLSELRENDESADNSTSIFIGVLFACGCFIRPTFALFSFVPLLVWCVVLSQTFTHQLKKTCSLLFAVIITSLFFAILDTIYYEGEYELITNPSYEKFKNIIFTPFNFVLYNINSENLELHGKHPRYLHFVVNMPLLYSVLGLLAVLQCVSTVLCLVKKRTLNCSKRDLFFLSSSIVPVILLSLFSHQEPRFLVPLVLPLICLCGEQLYTYLVRYKFVAFVWLTTNLLGILFYGFAHQGGVYPALNYLHTEIAQNPSNDHNIVFYHTYMPPRHLLAVPKTKRHVNVHDLSGSSDFALFDSVQTVLNYSRVNDKLSIVLPSTVTISLINLNIMLQPNYKVHHIKEFFPHVSTEAMPSLSNIWLVIKSRYTLYQKLINLKSFCSLNIYEVRKAKDVH